MSIIQGFMAGVVNTGEQDRPDPGTGDYVLTYASAAAQGTPYDPGGVTNTVLNSSSGLWRRHFTGNWNSGSAIGNLTFFNTNEPIGALSDRYVSFGDRDLQDQDNYAFEWLGYIQAPSTNTFNFAVTADDYVKMWIGTTAIEGYNNGNSIFTGVSNSDAYNSNSVNLTAGKWYPVRIWFQENEGAERMQLFFGVAGATLVSMSQCTLAYNSSTHGFNPPPVQGSGIFNQPESDYMSVGSTEYYGGSLRFVRTYPDGQYLNATVPAPDTGSVTYEWWFNQISNTGTHGMLQTRTGTTDGDGIDVSITNYQIVVTTSGNLLFQGGTVTTGFWVHIALVRDGSTNWTVYLNGLSIGTFNFTNTTGTELSIGRKSAINYNEFFDGYITNFRYVKGTAVYTGNFTPATTPLSATQPNGGWGKTSNIMPIESGTELLLLAISAIGYITDSSGNSVSVTNNNSFFWSSNTNIIYYDFNLGTTWTIEFWIKANNSSNSNINIPGGQWGLINQGGWYYGISNNSILIGLAGGFLSIAQDTSHDIQFAEPTPGVWTHVAVVNNGGGSAQKVYYNGVEQTKTSGSYYSNGWTNIRQPLYIGRLAPSYGGHFDGKLTNIRITNTAVYTSSFEPTIKPALIEGNTKLLWAPDSVELAADTGDYTTTITNNGVTYSTDYPFRGSVGFDNTPTYLAVTGGSQFNLGASWTVEWWQKADVATISGNILTILCQGPGDINQGRFDVFSQNGNLYVGNGNSIGAEPTPGVWTHVALVNNSGLLKVYYNGVQQYSTLVNYSISSTDDVYIGRRGPSVNGQHFRGKLTNMHIINNADKYTGAFTPDVLPSKVAGTKFLWTPTNYYGIVADISSYGATMTNIGSATINSDYPS